MGEEGRLKSEIYEAHFKISLIFAFRENSLLKYWRDFTAFCGYILAVLAKFYTTFYYSNDAAEKNKIRPIWR